MKCTVRLDNSQALQENQLCRAGCDEGTAWVEAADVIRPDVGNVGCLLDQLCNAHLHASRHASKRLVRGTEICLA